MRMGLDTSFHIWFIMTVYSKMRQILLQNAAAILLQNATVLLQNATDIITNCDDFITKCDDFITKCDVYYKLQQYIVTIRRCTIERIFYYERNKWNK